MMSQAVETQPERRMLIIFFQHVKHMIIKQARIREDDSDFYLRGGKCVEKFFSNRRAGTVRRP